MLDFILDFSVILLLVVQLALVVLFVMLYMNVAKIKKQISDKNLYKKYSVCLAMGEKEKALQYLKEYYYSCQFEGSFSEDEEAKIKMTIQALKSEK